MDKLRTAFKRSKSILPFEIDAAVILPDHFHILMTLPEGEDDFSTRVALIKLKFTKSLNPMDPLRISLLPSGAKKRESSVWQRRFWEHTIRDEDDFKNHLDYIHYNPVKHGYVNRPVDWQWSSFQQWVLKGEYDIEWGVHEDKSLIKSQQWISKHSGE